MNPMNAPTPPHRYDTLRHDLEALAAEFKEAGQQGRSVGHERLTTETGGGDVTEKTWRAFAAAHPIKDTNEWQEWKVSPNGETLERYYGILDERDLAVLTRLAERGFDLLRSIQALEQKGFVPPEGYCLTLPDFEGRAAWVRLLYETAELGPPPPGLRLRGDVWGLSGPMDWEKYHAWGDGPGGVRIPLHPTYISLDGGLFRASAKAIQFWLDPEEDGGPVRLPPGEAAPDGPVPPDKFRFRGQTYEGFAPLEMRLLECLWGRDVVKVQDAVDHVYEDNPDKRDGALQSLAKRVRAKLSKQDCPAEIHFKAGYVYLYRYDASGTQSGQGETGGPQEAKSSEDA